MHQFAEAGSRPQEWGADSLIRHTTSHDPNGAFCLFPVVTSGSD